MAKKSIITDSTTLGILLDAALYAPYVEVAAGVTNTNGTALYGDDSAVWAVTNLGTIQSAFFDGLHLLSGSVTNLASISGGGSGNGFPAPQMFPARSRTAA